MFSEMLDALRAGMIPESVTLGQRLRAGLTKKAAILRQPPPFWPGDPKINPPAAHLLWAAIIVADQEGFELAADLMVLEQMKKYGGAKDGVGARRRLELIRAETARLLHLLQDMEIARLIRKKAENLLDGPVLPDV